MTASTKPKITVEMVQFLLASEGWSQYRITKEFAISSKTVSRIANEEYEKKAPCRKRKLDDAHIVYIVECAFFNPRSSILTIAQQFMIKFSNIKISDQTVRNIIKEHGFKYLSARKFNNSQNCN